MSLCAASRGALPRLHKSAKGNLCFAAKSEMHGRALALACALGARVPGRPSLRRTDSGPFNAATARACMEKEQPGPEKKCLDAAGEAVWCTSTVAWAGSASDPSPERKSLAQIPEKEPQRLKMKCLGLQDIHVVHQRGSVSNASNAATPAPKEEPGPDAAGGPAVRAVPAAGDLGP